MKLESGDIKINMTIGFFENDIRAKNDPTFPVNMGSFSKIIWNLNKELVKLGKFSPPNDADVVGFASGLDLDFGFSHKKRALIHVWETSELPDCFLNFRRNIQNYHFFGLSPQISEVWGSYAYPTPVIDIGVDTEFWQKTNDKKFEKFTILSTTSCNFRSGINFLIQAFLHLDRNEYRLVIKDTENRNTRLPYIVGELKKVGYDIEYICERWDDYKIRELYSKSHLLCYNVSQTSAGLVILEGASCELPCLVGNFCPTNIYPSSEVINALPVTIQSRKELYTREWGLPYTFPENFIDESKALLYDLDIQDFVSKIKKVKENYDFYTKKAIDNRAKCKKDWSWEKSARKLVEILEK